MICNSRKGYFPPGCMGGAVYGKDGCTCRETVAKKNLEDKQEFLEGRVKKLEKMVKTLQEAQCTPKE